MGPVAWWRMDRLGRASPPVEAVVARACTFGSPVGQVGQAALVALHDSYAPVTYLPAPAVRGEQLARSLAAAVGTRLEHADAPDLAAARWLEARPDPLGAHESQAGGDPSVAMALARALAPKSFAALRLTLSYLLFYWQPQRGSNPCLHLRG